MSRDKRIATIPNAITLSRMALLIPVVRGILSPVPQPQTLALTALWASTDWVDGVIARGLHQQSRVGEVIDPVADRLGIAAVAGALTSSGSLPALASAAIAVTDVIVVAGAGRAALEGRIHVSKLGKLRSLVMFVGMTALVGERSGYASLGNFGRATTLVGVGLHAYCGLRYLSDAFNTRPRRLRKARHSR